MDTIEIKEIHFGSDAARPYVHGTLVVDNKEYICQIFYAIEWQRDQFVYGHYGEYIIHNKRQVWPGKEFDEARQLLREKLEEKLAIDIKTQYENNLHNRHAENIKRANAAIDEYIQNGNLRH